MASRFVSEQEPKNKLNPRSEDFLVQRAAVCALLDQVFVHLGQTIEGGTAPFPLTSEALYGLSYIMREMGNGIFEVVEG